MLRPCLRPVRGPSQLFSDLLRAGRHLHQSCVWHDRARDSTSPPHHYFPLQLALRHRRCHWHLKMHLLVSSDFIRTRLQIRVCTVHHLHCHRQLLTRHRGWLIQCDRSVSLSSLLQHRRSWHNRCQPVCQEAPVASDSCSRKYGTIAFQWRLSSESAPLQSTDDCRRGNRTRYRTLVPRLWFRSFETFFYPFDLV